MFKIALDAMGGDHAPKEIVEGAIKALEAFPELEITLFGNQEKIEELRLSHQRLFIHHTSEKIESDDEPVAAIRRKKDASMVVAATAVKNGQMDAIVSAGNTGALLAAGLLVIGRIKGIDRPGLMPVIPTANSQHPRLMLMDAGANAECKPVNLQQFAVLANFYARDVFGIQTPKIGLVNNGTEETKGNELTKAAHQLLKNEKTISFVGNVEAKELLNGVCDIAIADGFTGNAILKTLEGTAKTLFTEIKGQLLNAGPLTKLAALLIKPTLAKLKDKFDDSKQGGAILLGVKAPVIKAHGSSNNEAIFHAIRQAKEVLEANIVQSISDYFQEEV